MLRPPRPGKSFRPRGPFGCMGIFYKRAEKGQGREWGANGPQKAKCPKIVTLTRVYLARSGRVTKNWKKLKNPLDSWIYRGYTDRVSQNGLERLFATNCTEANPESLVKMTKNAPSQAGVQAARRSVQREKAGKLPENKAAARPERRCGWQNVRQDRNCDAEIRC